MAVILCGQNLSGLRWTRRLRAAEQPTGYRPHPVPPKLVLEGSRPRECSAAFKGQVAWRRQADPCPPRSLRANPSWPIRRGASPFETHHRCASPWRQAVSKAKRILTPLIEGLKFAPWNREQIIDGALEVA